MFPRFLLLYYSETYTIKAVTEKPEQSRYKLNFYQTIAMKNNSKNVAWANFRTATQVVAIMAVILVTLIACGKSDSGGSVDNKNLIGTWKFESRTIDGKDIKDFTYEGQKIKGECYKMNKLVFTDKEVVAYSYNSSRTNINQCEEEITTSSYVVSGNTIVFKGKEKAGSATISVVGNKLILSVSGEDDKGNKHTSVETYVKQ